MQQPSNFSFLEKEYPEIAKLGQLAERNCFTDPSTTLSKLRILTEKMAKILIGIERLQEPLDNKQVSRLSILAREEVLPQEMVSIFHTIRKSGNKASHDGTGTQAEARYMLRQAFYVSKWFYEVYEDIDLLQKFVVPKEDWFVVDDGKSAILEEQLSLLAQKVKDYEDKISSLQLENETSKEERKVRSKKKLRKIDENEAQTRERIDQQLRDAGWLCDTELLNHKKNKNCLPEKGKNKAIAEWKCGNGYADYALFIGLDLVGVVEAKKHIKNVMSDIEQAKRYSRDITESDSYTLVHKSNNEYKIPFVFSSNGKPYLEQFKEASGIWFWDSRQSTNMSRPLQNWFSPQDLKDKLLFDESLGKDKLLSDDYNYLQDQEGLNLRGYQVEAIKAVENNILNNSNERRSLLAMATGTGKTRTIIGMCYRLIKSGVFNRILFLVDRRMLGQQARDSFKEVRIEGLQTFAEIYDIKDLKDANAELDTKIHFATVQSLVKRVIYSDEAPSIGEYDCIIVDEAHRGYTLDKEMDDEELALRDQLDFQSKYRKVLDYFDAYRIGLTATPAAHTAEIFGKPVYTYSYRQAVVDGWLIDFEPPYVFQTTLSKNGIVWNKGDEIKVYDPEENKINSIELEDDEIKVEIEGFNKKVITRKFNEAVIQELIENYNIHPDNPEKTMVFAASDQHADTVVSVFRDVLKELDGTIDNGSIVKITGSVNEREDLLRKFKNDTYPNIVVTVDLLTTGIDVPSISNLIFLRRVNSRILYDQMLGRATRKCDEIGKEVFRVFDCVGVTETMMNAPVMKPVSANTSVKFTDLVQQIAYVNNEETKLFKLDRLLAKLHKKVTNFSEDQIQDFQELSGFDNAKELTHHLKSLLGNGLDESLEANESLWTYLDQQKTSRKGFGTLFSDHDDRVEEVSRAYEKDLKPKDYLESFNEFINKNKNEIAALKIVCTKPASLTRKNLRELKLLLDENGFNKLKLNTAYKQVKNEDIVADIIAHIRTAALGTNLISHDDRIKNAVDKLKANHNFNSLQIKWIDRIEKQLLQENIIQVENLDQAPFTMEGGKTRLDKIFKTDTTILVNELNNYLYQQAN